MFCLKSECEKLPGCLAQKKYSNLSQKIQLGNFRFFSAAQVCVANHIPAVICRCCSVSNIVYIFTEPTGHLIPTRTLVAEAEENPKEASSEK